MAAANNSTSVRQFIAYRVTCVPTGKSYIGITNGSLERRWKEHVYRSLRGTSTCRALQDVICQFGPSAFAVEHIACALDYGALKVVEKALIVQEGTLHPAGYNLTSGGQGTGSVSEATRARRSASLKGRNITEEHRKKISDAHRGRKHTGAALENMRAGQKAKKWQPTADQLAKRAEKVAGVPRPAAVRAKISAAQIGKPKGPLSPETRAKMSAARTGKKRSPFSPEHRARLSAATSARYAALRQAEGATSS